MISTSEKASLIRKMFGAIEFSRDNINVAVRCPACAKSNRKKKLVIRIDDERFHCWVCDIKGRSLLPLVKKYAPSFLYEYRKTSNKEIVTDSTTNVSTNEEDVHTKETETSKTMSFNIE